MLAMTGTALRSSRPTIIIIIIITITTSPPPPPPKRTGHDGVGIIALALRVDDILEVDRHGGRRHVRVRLRAVDQLRHLHANTAYGVCLSEDRCLERGTVEWDGLVGWGRLDVCTLLSRSRLARFPKTKSIASITFDLPLPFGLRSEGGGES
jgi:hypothetical protein